MHRRVVRWAALILMALFSLTNSTAQVTTQEHPVVLKIQLANEVITPVTAHYIPTAIRQAEEQRVAALILALDTPGGLVESTREVVRNILQSKVSVVVYVAPAGGRAASAGVFITMAGHVAAMAPGTNIGAAHPVQIGGLPGSPPQQPAEKKPAESKPEGKSEGKPEDQKDESKEAARPSTPMEEKIVNNTVAWRVRWWNCADATPMAMQMRFLQIVTDVGKERSNTLVLPVLMDLLSAFLPKEARHNGQPKQNSRRASHSRRRVDGKWIASSRGNKRHSLIQSY